MVSRHGSICCPCGSINTVCAQMSVKHMPKPSGHLIVKLVLRIAKAKQSFVLLAAFLILQLVS
jgi:hypothetical protein